MLEYENQMLLDLVQGNALLVSAKGICIQRVIQSLIKVYCDPGNLVLVLGFKPAEEAHILETLLIEGVDPLPRTLSAETTSAEREKLYLQGGVLFVSARILVVDLLKGRVPIAAITGIIINKAHTILESCQEAFAVRLYRQQNKTGFIKAFSTSPQAFTTGFAQVLRVMKTLFVKNLMLWPRFHAIIQTSLSTNKPEVVELHLPLTPSMKEIQDSLLELIVYCVRELRRYNPTLDIDELSVEGAIAKPLHKILQHQLDPLWHQLSAKTRQLVADLKTLRTLLSQLTQYDCATFYSLLLPLRSTEYAHSSAGWVLLPAAETLFLESKSRLCGSSESNCDPEINPKWTTLFDVLTEINGHLLKNNSASEGQETVLILTEDRRTCYQLKQFLTLGAIPLLTKLTNAVLGSKNALVHATNQPAVTSEELPKDEDQRGDREADQKDETEVSLMQGHCLTMSQCPVDNADGSGAKPVIKLEEPEETTESSLPQVLLEPMYRPGDTTALGRLLETTKPSYVVMYDANVTAIRQLEVFQARHPEIQLQIFFLIYGGSVEEQAYLTTLRREKEAFEFLVKEKSTMVIPADIEGLDDDNAILSRDNRKASEAVVTAATSSRQGGSGQEKKQNPLVLVDMREFRSELPALLHRRGIDIEPITLQVGDYILTPELCVERKSVSDLIGSLQTGRLYQQATAMTRHYAKPVLLIEFDQNKPFQLQGKFYVSTDIASRDAVDRLQLLTIHFPRLRLIWSPSPYATAELFEELKHGRAEPDVDVAASLGVNQDVQLLPERYNASVREFVSRLPGITSKNLHMILNKGQSLDHLLSLSEEDLVELLQNTTEGKALYNALHGALAPALQNKQQGNKKRKFSRFAHAKRTIKANNK
jgi:DNA excision repair protein ERCC-4